ncbi:MAG: DUF983 domain-containing protein [Bradyrhizobium sp.]|nr:MAG: DUF983 domain-containing protein [Bradyrhizobium sp.]
MVDPAWSARLSPILAGLRGRCPRCGKGPLFSGFIKLGPACSACGLDFSFADAGDGPAVFVALIGGFLVLGAMLAVQIAYEPPLWVYPLVFVPLTIVVCLGLLRPFKGLLIASQFVNRAGDGRLEGP